MDIKLIAVGRRMPAWVTTAYRDYAARLPKTLMLALDEVSPGTRGRAADTARAIRDEGARMSARIPDDAHVVALDERGSAWTTRQLAAHLSAWREAAQPVALLVGGPDGLAPDCSARAHERWSLSPLTLPHALVRVVVAEQLYRAWTLLTNHPYHRD